MNPETPSPNGAKPAEDPLQKAVADFAATQGNKKEEHGNSAARKIVKIGLENSFLFADERGTAFAAIGPDDARILVPVTSTTYTRFLAQRYYLQEDKIPTGENIGAARNILAAEAIFNGPRHTLHNRFARHDGAFWIDLADKQQRAARVDETGWQITAPPILFRRFRSQAPLPEPSLTGDLKDILRFVNVKEEDQILFLVWTVTAVLGHIPRPILLLHGVQGAAKTTVAKILRRLTDPSASPTNRLSNKDDELALTLETNAVVIFDNLTAISSNVADMLCQAVTGGGFEKRELFTDSDQIVYSFKRAIIATGINVPTHAPDLLDRCLLINLERIKPETRKLEEDLWADFDAALPGIFSGLLMTLHDAVRRYSEVKRSGILPKRMADFTIWGAAVAESLGYGAGAFVAAYGQNVERQTQEVLDSDPVARALLALASEVPFDGSISQLHTLLRDRNPDEAKQKYWPSDATRLSRRLTVLASTLADSGLPLTMYRTMGARCVQIPLSKLQTASSASSASEPAPAAVPGHDADHDASVISVISSVTPPPFHVPHDADHDANDADLFPSVIEKPAPAKGSDAHDAHDAKKGRLQGECLHSRASTGKKVVSL